MVHNDREPTTDDVCERYFRLGGAELDYVWPFSVARSRAATGATKSGIVAGEDRANVLRQLARRAVLAVTGEGVPDRGRLTRSLESWIEEFRPQALYTILGTNGMMSLVDSIRRRFGLPMVIHMMDDWPATAYSRGLIAPWQRRRMEDLLSRLVGAADVRMGICEAMSAAYSVRYERPFVSFQNAVDTRRWSALARADLTVGTPADILYVGSIFPNAQLDSLIDCCHAVSALNESGRPARLTISSPSGHASRYARRLAIDAAIRVEGAIEGDETFFRRIASADLLLLPANFDDASTRFIRYSMPTKVPAYLAVGTPILCYGPRGVAQIDYAYSAEWAHVVSEKGIAPLVGGLERVLENASLRRRLQQTALRVAAAFHDAADVRARFQDILCKVGARSLPKAQP